MSLVTVLVNYFTEEAMANNSLYLALVLILIFSIGCNESDNSDSLNLPADFDLETSECPVDDIRSHPNQTELSWVCMTTEGEDRGVLGTLSGISFSQDCFTLESKVDNWCLISPIGRAMFTATHVRYNIDVLADLPPPDENGCRIDERIIVEELICELERNNNN